MDTPNNIAIIPARAGSKRVRNKNLRNVAGKPLIEWTIEQALASEQLSCVLVSTDSEEIANVARQAGAEVPFLRSEHLATDTASTMDAIDEVMAELDKRGRRFDVVTLLQPTSPLRTAGDIDEALLRMATRGADGVISICECEHSPLWTKALGDDLDMANFLPSDLKSVRSQDLPKYYRVNGAIYAAKQAVLAEAKSFYLDTNVCGYLMPAERSVDIDTELDLQFAELLLGRASS